MKRNIFLIAFLLFSFLAFAEDPPPGPGGDPGDDGGTPIGGGVPIDGGLSVLLIAGASYAGKKLYDKKNKI